MNTDAAISQGNLNRIDQVTPQGSLTYTQNGVNADGTPRYTQTQTYSADEQAKYDQQNKIALALGDTAVQGLGNVQETMSKPFNYDGINPLTTNVQAGELKYGVDTGAPVKYGVDGRPIQQSLDYSGLTKLPGVDDFGEEAKRTSDAVYKQAASRLDPQWAQNDNDVKAQLAAQGISNNSEAYRREYDNMMRAKNDAYNQANWSAVQAGSQEQSRLFGLGLAARQQGQSEVNDQGQFYNSAQGQEFAQGLSNAELNNAAQGQVFGQGLSNAALHNTAQGQAFNQGLSNAQLGNSARQQDIEQKAYLRNMPINDIALLMGTGGGVTDPNFSAVPQVGVAAPDYAGMVQNQYTNQMNQYNAQQAAKAQMYGSIFGAAGTAAGYAAMSDMRLKENIKRIGSLASGIATYTFNYIGDKARQFGVMAQEVLEVMPAAVIRRADGYMMVDYGKVYNGH